MIVWGGYSGLYENTGSVYDPATDTWTPTSTTNVPSGRFGHTAVWTGSRMVVWGGNDGLSGPNGINTGSRYDPAADAWDPTPTSTTGAPSNRYQHTAVWTGSRMIVWGGYSYPSLLDTGGRYDPETDTWIPTS